MGQSKTLITLLDRVETQVQQNTQRIMMLETQWTLFRWVLAVLFAAGIGAWFTSIVGGWS